MSAWRIGRESVEQQYGGPKEGPITDVVDTVVKWIPGEVLALYAAGVTLIGRPSTFWLVVGIVLAPLVVLLAAFARTGRLEPGLRTLTRAGLMTVAAVIWSFVVPLSGWAGWSAIADNSAVVALTAALGGLIFGLVAEGVSARLDSVAVRAPLTSEPPTNPIGMPG